MPPAARIGDMHTCPMVTGTVPHVGGPVTAGCPTVMIGFMPAARIGDMLVCVGPPDTIVKGSPTVMIGSMPAARLGDNTAHGGVITIGHLTTMIGDAGSGGGGGGGGGGAGAGQTSAAGAAAQGTGLVAAKEYGTPFCEICHGMSPAVIADVSSPAESPPAQIPPPQPAPPQPTVCHLHALTLKCGHGERGYTLIAGQLDKAGRPTNCLEVVCGPEGDPVDVATELDLPYCESHLAKPLAAAPGPLRNPAKTPTKATGRVLALPPSGLDQTLARNPFALLWPKGVTPQKYTLSAPACGAALQAQVAAYPDVYWKIELGIQLAKDEKRARTPHQDASAALPAKTRIEVSYGRTTRDLSLTIDDYLRTGLTVAKVALDCFDRTLKLLGKYAGVELKLIRPNVFVRGAWGWKEIPGTWQAGYELKITAGFNPLIGISVEVDIISAILTAVASPGASRLKKLLDRSVAEVGLYLSSKGQIGGEVSATRLLGQPRTKVDGEINGSIEVALEGRAKREKKWLLFTATAEAKMGAKTSLTASLKPAADDRGFGVDTKLEWKPLTLYVVAAVSAGFELEGELACELWDPIEFGKGRHYFVQNGSGGGA